MRDERRDEPGLLFVYGTLRPRTSEERSRYPWRLDAVRGRLFDLGPYPALVELDHPGAGWVEGEVRPTTIRELEDVLDPYENVAEGQYARRRTRTQAGLDVWLYIYARQLPAGAIGPLPRWIPAEPGQSPARP